MAATSTPGPPSAQPPEHDTQGELDRRGWVSPGRRGCLARNFPQRIVRVEAGFSRFLGPLLRFHPRDDLAGFTRLDIERIVEGFTRDALILRLRRFGRQALREVVLDVLDVF